MKGGHMVKSKKSTKSLHPNIYCTLRLISWHFPYISLFSVFTPLKWGKKCMWTKYCTLLEKKGNVSGNRDTTVYTLHELVPDITRKSESHELIRVVTWTNSGSISVSPLHFIYFLTVCLLVLPPPLTHVVLSQVACTLPEQLFQPLFSTSKVQYI